MPDPSPQEISSVDFNARFQATQNQRNTAQNEAAVLCGQLALADKDIERHVARIAELEEVLATLKTRKKKRTPNEDD